MLRGILLGSVSGLALSVLFLITVSLILPPPSARVSVRVPDRPDAVTPPPPEETEVTRPAPLPEREPATETAQAIAPADAVVIPAGSQFGRPREDGAVVTPDRDERPGLVAGSVPDLSPPMGGAPLPDTSPADIPETAVITALAAPPPGGSSPNLPAPIAESAPQTFRAVVPSEVVEDLPLEGDPNDRADIASDDLIGVPFSDVRLSAEAGASQTAATTITEQEAEPLAESPLTSELPTNIERLEAPAVAPAEIAQNNTSNEDRAPVGGARPTILTLDSADEGGSEPVGTLTSEDVEEATDPQPTLPRRLVLDSERQNAPDAGDEATAALPEPSEPAGALDAYSVEVDRRPQTPSFAIVLIDTPQSGLDREMLSAFSFPVTFAIDAAAADATEVMRFYRDAGHEVVLLADTLAPDGTPQDIEIAVAGARAAVPEAVAVLDRDQLGFTDSTSALEAILPSLEEAGMGLIAHPGGLGTGVTTALREGVPATQLYRVLDDEDQRSSMIVRFLDRATFEAAQDGAAVVVGRTTPDTVAALFSWALGDRADQVDVVPISAILRETIE